jgi:hypothetical protein
MVEVLTLLIGVLVFLIYERIAWLTGAMESHSSLMVRIEALRDIRNGAKIELKWWDPSIAEFPTGRRQLFFSLATIKSFVPSMLGWSFCLFS